MYVILTHASATHHRTERENQGIPGKKLQLHKAGKNFKVNDDSYELLYSRPTSTFRYFTQLHIFKLPEKLIPYYYNCRLSDPNNRIAI
jgi:hypothetical protein